MNTVFLDTETTGLNPRFHQLLEVAMIMDDPDGMPVATWHFSLPIDVSKAEDRALEVNRYHARVAELAAIEVDRATALRYFKDALTGNLVVGNNVQFDLRFIEQFLVDMFCGSNATPWNYNPVDLKALVAGRYRLGPAPWSTGMIAQAAGVPIGQGSHTALVDASWNQEVYYNATEGDA